jgi:bifunctional NMN adenylyltransferase/nudix hydrolase
METLRIAGVIIARFQVTDLHVGHRYLLDYVQARHQPGELVVLLGVTGGQPTDTNFLDFETRKQMLLKEYPQAHVLSVNDSPSDTRWSAAVDRTITAAGFTDAVLYGSRESFAPHYVGNFQVHEVVQLDTPVSGTALRAKRVKARRSRAFRQGMLYQEQRRFPTSYQAVDVAVLRTQGNQRHVLLGKKDLAVDELYFIGGFVDPTDTSLEHAARREGSEEAPGIEMADLHYVCSHRQNDARYRGARDQLMTVLFTAQYIFGHTKAGDDMASLEWVLESDVLTRIAPVHRGIAEKLIEHLAKV